MVRRTRWPRSAVADCDMRSWKAPRSTDRTTVCVAAVSWRALGLVLDPRSLREEPVRPQRTTNGKGKEITHSLPLSTYSAPGALRHDPGRAAESPPKPEPAEVRDSGSSCAPVDV